MFNPNLDKDAALSILNQILEHELAGIVRYTHYSFMVFGHSRIPICGWLRNAASEGLRHANEVGELITHLGGYPSLGIGQMLDSRKLDIRSIMIESLEFESEGIRLYRELLAVAEGKSVIVEEFARQKIVEEENHYGDIDKMLRKPGETAAYQK